MLKAAHYGFTDCVIELVKAKANINTAKQNNDAIYWAKIGSNGDTVSVLEQVLSG